MTALTIIAIICVLFFVVWALCYVGADGDDNGMYPTQLEDIPEGHSHAPPHPNCALYQEMADHGLRFNPRTGDLETIREPTP